MEGCSLTEDIASPSFPTGVEFPTKWRHILQSVWYSVLIQYFIPTRRENTTDLNVAHEIPLLFRKEILLISELQTRLCWKMCSDNAQSAWWVADAKLCMKAHWLGLFPVASSQRQPHDAPCDAGQRDWSASADVEPCRGCCVTLNSHWLFSHPTHKCNICTCIVYPQR